MTLEKLMNLKEQLLDWHNDIDCTEIRNCNNCPFTKNEICEKLQEICEELKNV